VDADHERDRLRHDLDTGQRTAEMQMRIDPGFVHHRKIQTLVGPAAVQVIDAAIAKLPQLPDPLRQVRVDHIYSDLLVAFCRKNDIPSLATVLGQGRARLFCSTERVAAAPELYDAVRAVSQVEPAGRVNRSVFLEYTTSRIASDTLRSRLRSGSQLSIIAQLDRAESDRSLHFDPLVMGFPWLAAVTDPPPFAGPEWWSYAYGEVFIEDMDELAAVRADDPPEDWSVMANISEQAFKTCLAEILGAEVTKDWGGEQSDLYGAHVRLNGDRTSAAFLLKGPADFRPMTLNHLGKNNDQIYRLAQEPADLLVVQHCHEIRPPVRATLRAFAILPGQIRHYCFIDGRDSLRILQAHGKLERALELSGVSSPT
jgi:hypothetical protein